MHSWKKEPEKRPLDSLTVPGQREAVEKFLHGSSRETYSYNGDTIVIEEDPGMNGLWRYPMVTALEKWSDETIVYACVLNRPERYYEKI